LIFPKFKEGSQSAFKVEYDYRKTAGTSSFELLFTRSSYEYRVYATNYPAGDGADSGFDTMGGVRITNSRGSIADIRCNKAPTSLPEKIYGRASFRSTNACNGVITLNSTVHVKADISVDVPSELLSVKGDGKWMELSDARFDQCQSTRS
jgi:hypothetical protein